MFKITYHHFLKCATQHLCCENALAHVFCFWITFPIHKILFEIVSCNLFGTPEVQNCLEESIFLLVFLNDSLQIEFDLFVWSQLRVVNFRKLLEKLQNEKEMLLFFKKESPFDCLNQQQHFVVSGKLFPNIDPSLLDLFFLSGLVRCHLNILKMSLVVHIFI